MNQYSHGCLDSVIRVNDLSSQSQQIMGWKGWVPPPEFSSKTMAQGSEVTEECSAPASSPMVLALHPGTGDWPQWNQGGNIRITGVINLVQSGGLFAASRRYAHRGIQSLSRNPASSRPHCYLCSTLPSFPDAVWLFFKRAKNIPFSVRNHPFTPSSAA